MSSRLLAAIVLTTTLLLAGCAATVTKSGASQPPLEVSAAAQKYLVVQIKPAPGMPLAGNWEALKADWRDGMGVAAGQAGMLLNWQDGDIMPSDKPGVLVVVKIRHFRYMDPATRIGLGVFAGNAFVNAEIEFHELPAMRLLGTRVYGTTTSAIEGIMSATTKQQIQAMSNEIVSEITH